LPRTSEKRRGMPRLLFLLVLLGAGCDWFGSTPVEPSDGFETDDPADGADEADTAEIPADQAGDEDPVTDFPADSRDPVEETFDSPDEIGPQVCGNGMVEPPEVCDDGNTVTEYCGRNCLADCSLYEGLCGDGASNPGEACDDGNDDSMDACTTSCTLNNRTVGSPCRCTGPGCSSMDFTAGSIQGCENMPEMDPSTGAPACLRSLTFSPFGTESLYFPGGYCSYLAIECEGLLCSFVPSVGNVEDFHCPDPFVTQTVIYTAADLTLRMRFCLLACESPADCRWNAEEDSGACGQMDCLPHTDAPLLSVCKDARNTF
jgi:cysteine-rich repeat protein